MALEHCFRVAGTRLAILSIPKVAASSIRASVETEGEAMLASQAQDAGLFVAAFVRNPLDRLVSAWADKSAKVTPKLKQLGFEEGMSFPDFVRLAEDHFESDHHLAQQVSFVAPKGRLCADFIGRFEHLQDDWARLQSLFKLPGLAHENRSQRTGDWRGYYDKKTMLAACRIYRQDIRFFGYRDCLCSP